MKLFDVHAHLADAMYENDLPEVLARARAAGVENCCIIFDPAENGSDRERLMRLLSACPRLTLAAACHPLNARLYTEETEKTLHELSSLPAFRVWGEMGLDYHNGRADRELQISVLNRQLDMALETGDPVQLHIRDAHGDMLEILRKRSKQGTLPKGLVHSFSRSAELAKAYTDLGLYISVGAQVTYANSIKLREAVKTIPAERILVETDSPWGSFVLRKGERGEPAFITETVACVAELRNTDPELFARQVWKNTAAYLDL